MQLFTDEAASPHQNAGPAVLAGEEEKREEVPENEMDAWRPTYFSGEYRPLHQGNRVEEKLL